MKPLFSKGICSSALLLMVAACAGPTETEQTSASAETPVSATTEADVPAGSGRIIMYRTSILGLAVQPKVNVNGALLGPCAPRKVFSRQVPAGTHALTSKVLAEKAITVTTNGRDDVYVKCTITPGLVVGGVALQVVPASEGRAAVAKLTKS